MEVTIRIDCDNAAFDDYPGEELARILRKLADEIKDDGPHGCYTPSVALRDANGNTVGEYVVFHDGRPTWRKSA